jgi:hypothetical protein
MREVSMDREIVTLINAEGAEIAEKRMEHYDRSARGLCDFYSSLLAGLPPTLAQRTR